MTSHPIVPRPVVPARQLTSYLRIRALTWLLSLAVVLAIARTATAGWSLARAPSRRASSRRASSAVLRRVVVGVALFELAPVALVALTVLALGCLPLYLPFAAFALLGGAGWSFGSRPSPGAASPARADAVPQAAVLPTSGPRTRPSRSAIAAQLGRWLHVPTLHRAKSHAR